MHWEIFNYKSPCQAGFRGLVLNSGYLFSQCNLFHKIIVGKLTALAVFEPFLGGRLKEMNLSQFSAQCNEIPVRIRYTGKVDF